jgi:cytochrome c6
VRPIIIVMRPALLILAACLGMSLPARAVETELELGKRLFIKGAVPACAICHTLRDAGSEGSVGPVLDEIKPDAERVRKALRNGLGAMPSFAKTLSEAEIQALARYVAQASGGAPAK